MFLIIIEKFPLDLTVDVLTKHIRSLQLPITKPELVKAFKKEADFDKDVKKGPVFMKFYTETCPHCKALKRPYQRFAQHFENIVEFMDVDCKAHASFCSKNPVKGYPTLVLFNNGKKISFNEGDRSFITVEKFLNKHLNLEVRDFNNVGVSKSKNDNDVEEAVESEAENHKHDDNDDDDEHENHDHGEEKVEETSEGESSELKDYHSDLIEDLTSTAVQSDPRDKLVLFYKGSDADSEKVINTMENVAKIIKEKGIEFVFAKVNGDLDSNKEFYKSGGFKGAKFFTSLSEGGIRIILVATF